MKRWTDAAVKLLHAYATALVDYVVKPIDGAVREHVNAKEFVDALLAGLAVGGGVANVVGYMIANAPSYITGVDSAYITTVATLWAFALRLVQRYMQGRSPS